MLLEGVQPIAVLAIPRAAVLSDQQGDYVYVVDAQNKAQMRRIQLGQSTPSTAVVSRAGSREARLVIAEGLQRVRPGEVVSPGPASPRRRFPGLGGRRRGAHGDGVGGAARRRAGRRADDLRRSSSIARGSRSSSRSSSRSPACSR